MWEEKKRKKPIRWNNQTIDILEPGKRSLEYTVLKVRSIETAVPWQARTKVNVVLLRAVGTSMYCMLCFMIRR